MGYDASGTLSIVCTDVSQQATAALLVATILDEFRASDYGNTLAEEMQDSQGDVILRALAASGFSDGDKSEHDGQTIYSAYYDGKWWAGSAFVHRLAAESGMQIDGQFRGEDDAEWAWAARDGKTVEENIIHVVASEYTALTRARDDLVVLHALLASGEPLNDENLAQARSILSSCAPPPKQMS